MNVKRFIAANARDALRNVKDTLGAEAIILSNRTVPAGVEIMAVAASDMAMLAPEALNAASAPATPPVRGSFTGELTTKTSAPHAKIKHQLPAVEAQKSEPSRIPLGGLPAQDATTDRAGSPPSRLIMPPEGGTSAPGEIHNMLEEIQMLRRIVEQHFSSYAWQHTERQNPAKAHSMRILLDAGFSPKLSREIVEGIPDDYNTSEALAYAKGAIDRALITLNDDHDVLVQGGIYAFIGPTGVGKTTTVAKLAARYVNRHGSENIALLTNDGFRISAFDQLKTYGRILGVSVYLVSDAIELRDTLQELSNKHIILIDTVGMSQRDRFVAEQMKTFERSGADIRRLLLLAATNRGDTLDDIVHAYSQGQLYGTVLTKIDEAASLAPGLDATIRHQLKLCYVTNGQQVPADFHLPNRAHLMQAAFRQVTEESAHHHQGDEPASVMAGEPLHYANRG